MFSKHYKVKLAPMITTCPDLSGLSHSLIITLKNMYFNVKNIFAGLLIVLTFTNCQDVIDIDLDSVEAQLVIEGTLTDQPGKHQVRITKTVPFDQPNDFPAISGAFVTIEDNQGLIDTLREAAAGVYETQRLTKGEYERTYTLRVTTEGQQYTASSTMPRLVPFELLRADRAPIGNSMTVVPEFTDPVGLGNLYKFSITVNSERQSNIFTLNDELSDGRRSTRPLLGIDLESGDTCSVEMYCLDPIVFKYFLSLQLIESNGPGGGATPANPDNNFGNACLGYFSAHPLQVKTIVIP
jgi:hypothetical protein